ncbi:MAG: NAD(P)H-hydrate dehydratase [Actinomycetota bacterium]
MQDIVTPTEMATIDASAPEPLDELIERAGWHVAQAAVDLLGGSYGRRVSIVAGSGNNGADGRVAARHLRQRGVRTTVVEPGEPVPPADLVVDAAFGTGLSRPYDRPAVDAPVLAVDIPSGIDGLTGEPHGRPVRATATVTFAALKPGLLLGAGPEHAGLVRVVDIGLDTARASAWLLGSDDISASWPRRGRVAHKWQSAVWVVGGSPGMTGAPALAAAGAARAGAGYVTVSVPGATVEGPPLRPEVVVEPISDRPAVTDHDLGRYAALVIGPGLAPGEPSTPLVSAFLAAARSYPTVIDGGALDVIGARPHMVQGRSWPAVLTPHDGELRRLLERVDCGHPAEALGDASTDRSELVRAVAATLECVVVAKGPTTIAAHPDGRLLFSTAGDQRLATAGSGDVLAGCIGALLAQRVDPWVAAGLAAEVHGQAAQHSGPAGLVAGDLPDLVSSVVSEHLDPPGRFGP